jgi:hypothetical protein
MAQQVIRNHALNKHKLILGQGDKVVDSGEGNANFQKNLCVRGSGKKSKKSGV